MSFGSREKIKPADLPCFTVQDEQGASAQGNLAYALFLLAKDGIKLDENGQLTQIAKIEHLFKENKDLWLLARLEQIGEKQ